MTVAFFGHGKLDYSHETINRLTVEIEKLIQIGANDFLLGGYGNFDTLAASILFDLKRKYYHIKSTLVIPYLNKSYNLHFYDSTVYPDIENVPKRYAIVQRNRWMVENSDIIIFYVSYAIGGAYDTLKYAKRLNKRMINLSSVQ